MSPTPPVGRRARSRPAKYKDTYTNEVQKLIEAKAKGQKREAPAPKAAKSNVIDLVSAQQEGPWET
jgi:non-homologous end joining protein Ku